MLFDHTGPSTKQVSFRNRVLILFDQGVRPRHFHILNAELLFFIHIHYRRIVSCRRAVVQACGDLKTASLVVRTFALLLAVSGPDL